MSDGDWNIDVRYGRPATEIHDAAEEREAVGIPLIGVDFDVQTGSAQIMLGGLAGGDSHRSSF